MTSMNARVDDSKAEFLKVAVPEEEFPYVNSKAEMANLIFGMKAAATLFVWIWQVLLFTFNSTLN